MKRAVKKLAITMVWRAVRRWLKEEEIDKVGGIKYYFTFSSFHNFDRQSFHRYYFDRQFLVRHFFDRYFFDRHCFDRYVFDFHFLNGSRYQASEPTEK